MRKALPRGSTRAALNTQRVQAVERTDDARLARCDLDAALDFTGNHAMCQISKCCIGALHLAL